MHKLFYKTELKNESGRPVLKYFCFIIIYFALALPIKGQWIQQSSGVNTALYDVFFLDTQTGWLCGASGVILKTTNGGTNWTPQNSGLTRGLYSIHFINSNTGWIVSGIVGYILKTTNGGSNWITVYGTPLRTFNNVFALDPNSVWVTGVGVNGYIYKTTNGGNSWDSVVTSTGTGRDVIFFNQTTGIATFSSEIYKSTDGGNTWEIRYTGSGELVELTFIGNTGYTASTSYRIYKTTDQGNNWTEITQINGVGNCQDIFFNNLNTGYLCGDVDNMYKTTNGGFNWIRQNTQSGVFLSSVFFTTDSIGWTCGGLGKVFYTSSSGAYVGIVNEDEVSPYQLELKQNYPNPFNPSTTIEYNIYKSGYVSLKIFDILGNEIKILVNGIQYKGNYKFTFSSGTLSSGIYYYELVTPVNRVTKCMILIK